MAGEDVVGVGRVERISIDERGINRSQTQLQPIRYELFIDARREVRHGHDTTDHRLTSRDQSRECCPVELTVQLTQDDVALLVEALDAYEYWELGDSLPRNNGAVFIPGDLRPEDDRYWGTSSRPNEVEVEAIDRVRACRNLADRLAATSRDEAEPPSR